MAQMTVALIARDEARHIGAALASVQPLGAPVLVLLDERTSDATGEIAKAAGAQVVRAAWRGFPAQRNMALSLCQTPWVLFLDADERISPELAQELAALLAAGPTSAGYWIPRHNQFFGRTVRGGGWYPDPQLRLLCRARARYDEARLVHELVLLDGTAGHLRGHLLHLNIEQVGELWQKQASYARQEAQTLYREGRRMRYRNLVGGPVREFVRRYIRLGGWRDGAVGLVLCGTVAYFEAVKFAHLKGLELAQRGR